MLALFQIHITKDRMGLRRCSICWMMHARACLRKYSQNGVDVRAWVPCMRLNCHNARSSSGAPYRGALRMVICSLRDQGTPDAFECISKARVVAAQACDSSLDKFDRQRSDLRSARTAHNPDSII